MPLRQTEDVPQVAMTDHKIGKGLRTFTAVPRNDALPYAGGVIVYYPAGARDEPGQAAPAPVALDERTARGQALLRAGNIEGAVEAFRAAVNERPEIADIQVNLAAALIAAHRYAEAREQLEEAIRTGPSVETARVVWLRARVDGMTTEGATLKYQASLKAQMLSAHSNLGVVLGLLGRPEEAIAEFRRAVECDPASETAKANLRLALAGRQ
jgi:tetratricopeptide (TPR) repeat protein